MGYRGLLSILKAQCLPMMSSISGVAQVVLCIPMAVWVCGFFLGGGSGAPSRSSSVYRYVTQWGRVPLPHSLQGWPSVGSGNEGWWLTEKLLCLLTDGGWRGAASQQTG